MLLSTRINVFKNPLFDVNRILTSRYLHTLRKVKPLANIIDNPDYYPGKCSMNRLEEFYDMSISDNLMILSYKDPASEKEFIERRLKKHPPLTKASQDVDNPFLKHRPPLEPRG